MTRCPECGATLDSISELARHECEPTETIPTPEPIETAWREFDAK